MLTIRRADERGLTDIDWLHSRHTFSFGDYIDPAHHHYRSLRVINDDVIGGGGGFPLHPHRDMEILTRVLTGQLEHRDSMGNGEVISAGEWQAMTAGAGITHSEFNPSNDKPVHLLQIWIVPNVIGIRPSYKQTRFADADKRGRLRLIASNDGRDGSVTIHQDATVHAALLGVGEKVACEIAPSRVGYLHVARGRVSLDGLPLEAGDGARIGAQAIRLEGIDGDGEVLLFDLPA